MGTGRPKRNPEDNAILNTMVGTELTKEQEDAIKEKKEKIMNGFDSKLGESSEKNKEMLKGIKEEVKSAFRDVLLGHLEKASTITPDQFYAMGFDAANRLHALLEQNVQLKKQSQQIKDQVQDAFTEATSKRFNK